MKEALFYQSLDDNKVRCLLCPRECLIGEEQAGFCRVRVNREGKLVTESYGVCASYALDPIEKKPLYHFYPGRTIFSLGSYGCNFRCQFCQNWRIAQEKPELIDISPEAVVETTLRQGHDCIGIAYTYNEPLTWYEFVLETAQQAREAGLKNVLVTNGYVQEEPLRKILPYIDALNIDVKAYNEDFYRSICCGGFSPVLRTVEIAAAEAHVELTTLVIPGLNDNQAELEALIDWVAGINPQIPLHFSRYFPQYRMDRPRTPMETLVRAREMALKKLDYVYIGNLGMEEYEHTYCPECGLVLIKRSWYDTSIAGLQGNSCTRCGRKIWGRFDD